MQSPLKIEPATGLVAGARQVLSPFFDARPMAALPELIVVHGISVPPGEFGGPWIDRLFTGNLPADAHPSFKETSRLRVSAHALIRRDGTIVQYVPFGQRAWHAGQSHYRGRAGCNDFSIGIELEGYGRDCLHRPTIRPTRRVGRSLAGCLSVAIERPHRRAQRHRTWAQDRSGPVVRLGAVAVYSALARSGPRPPQAVACFI